MIKMYQLEDIVRESDELNKLAPKLFNFGLVKSFKLLGKTSNQL